MLIPSHNQISRVSTTKGSTRTTGTKTHKESCLVMLSGTQKPEELKSYPAGPEKWYVPESTKSQTDLNFGYFCIRNPTFFNTRLKPEKQYPNAILTASLVLPWCCWSSKVFSAPLMLPEATWELVLPHWLLPAIPILTNKTETLLTFCVRCISMDFINSGTTSSKYGYLLQILQQ